MYRSSTFEPDVADPLSLAESLHRIEPGQEIVYHRGHLTRASPEIRKVAEVARALCEAGKVRLHHRRLTPPKAGGVIDWEKGESREGFEYVVIGRKPAT